MDNYILQTEIHKIIIRGKVQFKRDKQSSDEK